MISMCGGRIISLQEIAEQKCEDDSSDKYCTVEGKLWLFFKNSIQFVSNI